MGNIELKGCCQLRKAFNIFNVRQTPQRVFENNFVEQITAQNYQQHSPDHEYWLILSVLCPTIVKPPDQDKYSVVGVWRYHEHPCGALVCIRVLLHNHTLAFLCEEATLGPHLVEYGPQDIDVLEMPFQKSASWFDVLFVSDTFTLQNLQNLMGPQNRAAILHALQNIPITAAPMFRQSPYQRPSLRSNLQLSWHQLATG